MEDSITYTIEDIEQTLNSINTSLNVIEQESSSGWDWGMSFTILIAAISLGLSLYTLRKHTRELKLNCAQRRFDDVKEAVFGLWDTQLVEYIYELEYDLINNYDYVNYVKQLEYKRLDFCDKYNRYVTICKLYEIHITLPNGFLICNVFNGIEFNLSIIRCIVNFFCSLPKNMVDLSEEEQRKEIRMYMYQVDKSCLEKMRGIYVGIKVDEFVSYCNKYQCNYADIKKHIREYVDPFLNNIERGIGAMGMYYNFVVNSETEKLRKISKDLKIKL